MFKGCLKQFWWIYYLSYCHIAFIHSTIGRVFRSNVYWTVSRGKNITKWLPPYSSDYRVKQKKEVSWIHKKVSLLCVLKVKCTYIILTQRLYCKGSKVCGSSNALYSVMFNTMLRSNVFTELTQTYRQWWNKRFRT